MAVFHRVFPIQIKSSCIAILAMLLFESAAIASSSIGTMHAHTEDDSTRKVSVTIGSSKEITIPWRRNVQVSRRGIIFLQHISDHKWRITGLRGGLVMINTDGKSQSGPIFVQVIANQKPPAKVTKDPDSGGNSEQDKLNSPPNAVQEERIVIRAYVTLIENSSSESSGVKSRSNINFAVGAGKPGINWKSQIAPISSSQSSNTIAAPIFNMFTGSTSTAHSGGEFRVQYSTDKGPDASREGWKEHGFRLAVTPELIESNLELTYSMSLKVLMSAGAAPNLSSNDLSGSLRLNKNEVTIAGVINFSGTGNETQSVLNRIPIIGPIFTERSIDLAKKRLVLWFVYEDPSDLTDGFGQPQEAIAPN